MGKTNERDGLAEMFDMCRQLIQEAKGVEGPNGGFVTNHLDDAENWLDKIEALTTAAVSAEPSEGVEKRARRLVFRQLLPLNPYTDAEMDAMLERPEDGPMLNAVQALSLVRAALTAQPAESEDRHD